MGLAQMLVPEFDMEIATTRKVLERVPEDKFGWKPHEKSGTLGWLAKHVAELPGWVGVTIKMDLFDLSPVDGPRMEPTPLPTTSKELLDLLDKKAAEARALLVDASDETMMKPWSLARQGAVLMTMPKAAVLRTFVLSHLIHHRGQLSVYLRLNDIPVPSIYGPSADENPFGM